MGKKTITFAIDSDNGITAYASRKEAEEAAGEGHRLFSSQDQLEQATAECSTARLIEIWNGIPGVEPVKKFTSRTVAIGRIWKAIQVLTPESSPDTAPQRAIAREPEAEEPATVAPHAAHVEPEPAKASKKAAAAKEPRTKAATTDGPKGGKTAMVIAMISKPGGATLAEIMKATGWLPHTTRSFMSTASKKHGVEVVSTKEKGGERTYSAETKSAAGV